MREGTGDPENSCTVLVRWLDRIAFNEVTFSADC